MRILLIVLVCLLLVACAAETIEKKEIDDEPIIEEDTGIDDVFEETDEVQPPVVPVT